MFNACTSNCIYDNNVLIIKVFGDSKVCKAIHLRAIRKKGFELCNDEVPP